MRGQCPKPNQSDVETEHWLLIGRSKTSEIRKERISHMQEYPEPPNNYIGPHIFFMEHHQDPPLEEVDDRIADQIAMENGTGSILLHVPEVGLDDSCEADTFAYEGNSPSHLS